MQVGKAFVVIIGRHYVNNENNYKLCLEAEKLNIPMYAIVISGTDWNKFKKFTWRKIIYVNSIGEIEEAFWQLNKDIDFYYLFVGGN